MVTTKPLKREGTPLELGQEGDGLYPYLYRRRIEEGTELQLKMADGAWLSGTIERHGKPNAFSFRAPITTDDPRCEEVIRFELPDHALFRWPD